MASQQRTPAVEMARTQGGVTDTASHLMRVGGGMTICGISIRPSEIRGNERIWYPVAEDESSRFMSCEMCERRSSAYYVVSRIKETDRPEDDAAPSSMAGVGNVVGLYGAIYNGVQAYMAGKSIVPHSIIRDVHRLLNAISDRAFGDGLTGSYSALDAKKALDGIRNDVSAICYDLDPYTPDDISTDDVPMLRERDRQISEYATRISRLCDAGEDEWPDQKWITIQNLAASIRGLSDGLAWPENDETASDT